MSIASSGSCRVPLEKVTQLMADLSDEITRWVSAGRGEIRYGTEVAAVRRNADSTFTTMDAVGNVLATSRTVVLGTGASEEVDDTGSMSPVMASGQLLSGDFAAVDEAVRANRTIAIVGTSHSGLSCTDLILQRHQGRLRRGQIILLYRNFSLFYDDLADYQDGLAGPSADLLAKPTVCSETGWINRYGGLRGRARNLCVQILAGNVPEVDLIRSDSAATSTRLIDAGAIVKACGYRGVAPEVQDADGRPVPLARRGGSFWADSACRLVGPSGPIEGLYGLGLGFARCASNGEKRVGINIFHGEDSTDIIQNLQDSVLTGGRSTYTREV